MRRRDIEELEPQARRAPGPRSKAGGGTSTRAIPTRPGTRSISTSTRGRASDARLPSAPEIMAIVVYARIFAGTRALRNPRANQRLLKACCLTLALHQSASATLRRPSFRGWMAGGGRYREPGCLDHERHRQVETRFGEAEWRRDGRRSGKRDRRSLEAFERVPSPFRQNDKRAPRGRPRQCESKAATSWWREDRKRPSSAERTQRRVPPRSSHH